MRLGGPPDHANRGRCCSIWRRVASDGLRFAPHLRLHSRVRARRDQRENNHDALNYSPLPRMSEHLETSRRSGGQADETGGQVEVVDGARGEFTVIAEGRIIAAKEEGNLLPTDSQVLSALHEHVPTGVS